MDRIEFSPRILNRPMDERIAVVVFASALCRVSTDIIYPVVAPTGDLIAIDVEVKLIGSSMVDALAAEIQFANDRVPSPMFAYEAGSALARGMSDLISRTADAAKAYARPAPSPTLDIRA